MPAAGRDRFGFVRPALAGLGMLASGSLLAGVLPSMNALYGASVLIGSGYMLAHVAISNAIGQASAMSGITRAF